MDENKINIVGETTQLMRYSEKLIPVNENEISDLISRNPPVWVKWGTFCFFIFLLSIAILCSFIKFPDRVQARGILTSVNAAAVDYYVELFIPHYDYEKVHSRQRVILKFEAYPFEQFGSVTGVIEVINKASSDSGYILKVSLPNGLTTNTFRKIDYSIGLAVKGDIITKDIGLLQSIFTRSRNKKH